MKKVVLMSLVLLMTLCTSVFADNKALIELNGVEKKQVMDIVVKTMLDSGFNLISVNEYQLSFRAEANDFSSMFLYGTSFNGTPELRVFLNFVQLNQNITISGEMKIVSNPNSSFEKSNNADPSRINTILDDIKSKFYGSVIFGMKYSEEKKNNCYEVSKVWKNSSAEKAGIEPGDLIKEVNGNPTRKMNFKKFDSFFIVPDETELNITIIKKTGEEKRVTIKKTFVPGEFQDLVKK